MKIPTYRTQADINFLKNNYEEPIESNIFANKKEVFKQMWEDRNKKPVGKWIGKLGQTERHWFTQESFDVLFRSEIESVLSKPVVMVGGCWTTFYTDELNKYATIHVDNSVLGYDRTDENAGKPFNPSSVYDHVKPEDVYLPYKTIIIPIIYNKRDHTILFNQSFYGFEGANFNTDFDRLKEYIDGWDIKDKEIVDLAHIPEWARKIFSVDKKLSWDKTLIFNSHQLHVSGNYRSDRVAITIWLKHL